MEATDFSETLIIICQVTWCRIPEQPNLHLAVCGTNVLVCSRQCHHAMKLGHRQRNITDLQIHLENSHSLRRRQKVHFK
jgi:hypothetical protein